MESLSKQEVVTPLSSPRLRVPNNTPTNDLSRRGLRPRMHSRALEVPMSTVGQQNSNSEFIGHQVINARFRRGAGIPSLHHGRGRSSSQTQVDEMNNAFFPAWPQEQNHESAFIPQNVWRQHANHGHRHLFDQQLSHGRQANAAHHTAFGSHNNATRDSAAADDHAQFQHFLYSAAQLISARSGLPPQDVAALTAELREMSQRNLDLRRVSQSQHGLLRSERERFSSVMSTQQQVLQNALSERDKACGERDKLQAQLTVAQIEQQELEEKLDRVEKKNAATLDHLRDQIRFKDEQLNGKRSLFIENRNRRDSGVEQMLESQDPFATPISRYGTRMRTGLTQTKKSEEVSPTHGPSKQSRLESELGNQFWPYDQKVNPASRVEVANSPVDESKALIPFRAEDQVARDFREHFDSTYELIEAWVRNYAHIVVDDMSYDQKLSHDEDLWPFLLSCTYVNIAEAHDHTIVLLRSPTTRSLLIIRLIIQYLYTSIWKATAFGSFKEEHQQKLELINTQLNAKGLEPAERARLIAAQTDAVKSIVEDEGYLRFRSEALSSHTRALRKILGSLLDAGVVRQDAARDISVIIVSGWDLSAKLYTSNYTFIFTFPAINSKFLHPSMECDDPMINESELQLHIRQARIKLTVKPIITMRNDRRMTITAKKIHNAHVLIFP